MLRPGPPHEASHRGGHTDTWSSPVPKGNVYSNLYSQAVTHPSTNRSQPCLTSVIRRELVHSRWYGRRHLSVFLTEIHLSGPQQFGGVVWLYMTTLLVSCQRSGRPKGGFQINKASLSGRSLNTEIFSKRRKIYSDLFRELEMIAVPWRISPKDVLSRRGVFVRLSLCHEWGVSRSWRYCNARSTRDEAGASSWTSSPFKNQFNIEGDTWSPYQILSW